MSLIDKNLSNSFITNESVEYILTKLINASCRQDANTTDPDLLLASYSAINKVIEDIPEAFILVVFNKTSYFLKLLEDTLNFPQKASAQVNIFTVLHSIFGRSQVGSISDSIADAFLSITVSIFKLRSSVVEEGLQAIGTLAENMQTRFQKYLPTIMPFVEWSIDIANNCITKGSVMCIGDFSRALGEGFASYLPSLIPNFEVKVRTIDTLSDFASHTCNEFSKYFTNIFTYIDSASGLSLDLSLENNNPDMHELLLDLRESIISFYIGVLQGANDLPKIDTINGYLPKFVDYGMFIVSNDYKPNANIVMSVLGMIGDIANYYKSKAAPFLKTSRIESFVSLHTNSSDGSVAEMAGYAKDRIKLI